MKNNKQFLLSLVTILLMLMLVTTAIPAEQARVSTDTKTIINNTPSISGKIKRLGSTLPFAQVTCKGIGIVGGVELTTYSNTQGYYTFTNLPNPDNFDQCYEITAEKTINEKEFKGSITVIITKNNPIKTGQDINIVNTKSKNINNPLMNLLLYHSIFNQRTQSIIKL
jgi:hypothetical protein